MSRNAFLVFVVEDNDWYNKLLVHNLKLNPDYDVEGYLDGKSVLKALDKKPDVITLDYRLPDYLGDEILKKIKAKSPNTEVIIISDQNDITTAVDLLKEGAYDYLKKTDDIKERLHHSISKIYGNTDLKNRLEQLTNEVSHKYRINSNIIGQSEAIKKVYNLVEKACLTNITTSIHGETGTGKEVIAKAIHYNSRQKNKPFIAVNLAAIPSELIESELFGHEKGAFTGAHNKRIGKFEEANEGTIFLDEIAEMDIQFQSKILRVLQEKEVTRIGSNKPIKISARIIVATHKNLFDEVKKGTFREDLYYRLLGLQIELPPLRNRGKDIPLLAHHFIQNFCKENQLSPKLLDKAAKKKLLSYPFPGNVRELKSIIELAVVMSSNEFILADDIQIQGSNPVDNLLGQELSLRQYDLRIVEHFMKKYNNKTKEVADRLQIGQTTVYRILKERI